MYPHRWARYRSDTGERWDTWHYDGEPEAFTDSDGVLWRRVAVTEDAFHSAYHAAKALDKAEESTP